MPSLTYFATLYIIIEYIWLIFVIEDVVVSDYIK